MKILIIEPDRVLGATYQNALVGAGHTVILRRSGQLGLDALDDESPDLVVLELQLGLHNGIEFLYELRSQADWQHLPIIVHTINSNILQSNYRAALAQLKVDQILYKSSTTLSQLVKAIEHTALVS